VIPVQFSDTEFDDPEFFAPDSAGKVPADDYLFGNHKDSLTQFFLHESLGTFSVSGELSPVVTLNGTLANYGEAMANGKSDKDARGLVKEAIVKIMESKGTGDWWNQFDLWDLSDYDSDDHFYEPDGFLDAVVLIYAGKSQASCQRSFDADSTRPATADVPAGPRHDSAVECFNRLWPHRWSISIGSDDPLYTPVGPLVEGNQRPSMNGLKINDTLYALDYNMQSEY